MYLPGSVSFILCVIRIIVHNVSAYQCKALSSELAMGSTSHYPHLTFYLSRSVNFFLKCHMPDFFIQKIEPFKLKKTGED